MIKEKLARYTRLALRLIFVPKCVSCGERMPFDTEEVLCPSCRSRYDKEKETICPTCASDMARCLCLPVGMERRGIKRMAKLIPYEPHKEETGARMIYALKHKNLRSIQDFLGKELAEPLRAILAEGDFVVTYPPRSQRGIREDGFDHARELSRAVAHALSLPHLDTLLRVRHTVQKSLSRTARLKEAAAAYALAEDVDLTGKRVILCDDVCTTGATLIAAARLLRRAGAKEVVCAAVAVTPHKNG